MNTIFNIKSFVRFLSRNKLFTAVNIFGFAISLTFVVLLGLYIQEELSINASQPNKERIYRLENESFAGFAPPIATQLQDRYPEIEATMRIFQLNHSIGYGTNEAILGEVLLVDSSFLTMFEIPFIEGNASSAMQTRDDVLLSEKRARQLFSDELALGKVVMIAGREMTVSGVFRDLKHTHFKTPDVIARFENMGVYWGAGILTQYNNNSFGLYVMTHPNVELTQNKMDEMKEFLSTMYNPLKRGAVKEILAEPLMNVYYTDKVDSTMRSNDKTFLVILGFTALLILLFAVINYINLSVAQAGFRAKEAALRRLFGGSKSAMFLGFIFESLIIASVSLFLGIMFAFLIEPWFQQVMWTDISVNNIFRLPNIALVLASLVAIGVISGLVPATVLTRFKPIDVVQGTFKGELK